MREVCVYWMENIAECAERKMQGSRGDERCNSVKKCEDM